MEPGGTMPYDSRPVSKGGNRGIDEEFSRAAPPGKFRVIGVDTFDAGDWVQGDFDTLEEAMKCAREKGGSMCKMHVYDDKGEHQGQAGTF
jgi:hypothetical protein